MPDAIVIDGLTKRFGRLTAVDNLSLCVPAGGIHGFLGLNGAGKTTTLRVLLGLIRPSAGRAEMLGHDCQRSGPRVRADVGYLPAECGLYADMTGEQALSLFGAVGRAGGRVSAARALLDALGFRVEDLGRRLGEYSTGMRRKLGLVIAFQHRARLLILDEPTQGLDPLVQQVFHGMLADCRRDGRTVFMSSHVLSDVDRLCDRVAVLREGRLVLEAPVEEVRALAPRHVRVAFDADSCAPTHWPPGIRVVGVWPRVWELEVSGELGSLLSVLQGRSVVDIDVAERRIEDVVVGFYGSPR